MPGKSEELLVGLSIGTTETKIIIAGKNNRYPDSIHVVGFGHAASHGIAKGVITNPEQATQSIKDAFRDAQTMTGIPAERLSNVVVAFNAMDIESRSSHGMVTLGDDDTRPVTTDDINRVIERARRDLPKKMSMYPLHTIPTSYSLDGRPVENPLNMTGNRLEVWLQTVSVPMTHIQDVINCVRSAELNVSGAGSLLLKPIVSSLGSLYEEEKQAGCISICIGGGTTGIVLYRGGRAFKVISIPIGGDHIRNDIATVLHIPLGEAERLKKRIFTTDPDDIRREGFDFDLATQAIFARVTELFEEYIADALIECTPQHFPNGVIFSGGVSETPGLDKVLQDVLQMPVRKVREPIYQMPMGLDNASYVSLAGILKYSVLTKKDPYLFIESDQFLPGVSVNNSNKAPEKKSGRPQDEQYIDRNIDEEEEDQYYYGPEEDDDEYYGDDDNSERRNFGEFMKQLSDRFKKLF